MKEYGVAQGREKKKERRKDQQALSREIGIFKLKIKGPGAEGDPPGYRKGLDVTLEKAKLSLRSRK